MGISASSLLDEAKSSYVKGEAETELKDFSPYYRRQFSIAHFLQVEDDLEQRKEKTTQLLMQKECRQEAEVLYEENLLFFDESRRWRDRYVVVRANRSLECHDSLETFLKGVPPRQKLLPTGGTVLTTEKAYTALVDRCFPDEPGVKEDFAPPLSGMPGDFPVYLRLPYRRDSYFCFKQEAKRNHFLYILSDCIRHQNQDFLKKKTCEVQAFLKAIQLRRQEGGRYESWDMLIGSDVRVMGNLVMEKLLPGLEKDLLPRLKAKKTEKKRVWFATVEAAYILAQEHLLEGLTQLKEECRVSARQQEVLIHSDMDQILESRRQLEEKVRAVVTESAEKLCSECVQPYLDSVLEELMEPISSGFQEGRQLIQSLMDEVCQSAQQGDKEDVGKLLPNMAKPNLLSCYQKIASMQDKQQNLHDRFGFSNTTGLIHSTQIDLEQLMENAAFTFEQLLHRSFQDNPDNISSAPEKAKERVLKQYDYDSSTVRKRISREALLSITLPFIKKKLDQTYKTEIRNLEQSVDTDHTTFIHVENVYENILQQTLDKEVTKVVKEAATLRKYDLFTDRELLSQTSGGAFSSPPAALNNLSAATQQVDGTVQSVTTILEAEPPKQVETPTSTDTTYQSGNQKVGAAPETLSLKEVGVTVDGVGVAQEGGGVTQEEVVMVQDKAAETKQEVDVTQEVVDVVPKEAAKTKQEVTVTQEEVGVVPKEAAKTKQEVTVTQEEVDVVQKETAETKQEVTVNQQEVDVVQKETAETKQEVAVTQEEVGVVPKEAAKTKQEVTVTQEEVDVVQKETAETKQEVAVTQEEVGVVQEEAAETKQEVDVTQEEVGVVQEEAVETKQEVDVTQEEVGVVQEEVGVVQKEAAETKQEVPRVEVEPPQEADPVHGEGGTKDAVSPAGVDEAVNASGGPEVQTSAQRPGKSSEAPPGVHSLQAAVPVSDSMSSNHESMKEIQATEDSKDEAPMTSDLLIDGAKPSPSPVSSVNVNEDKTKETESADMEAGTSAEVPPDEDKPPATSPPKEAESGAEVPPLDSIKGMHDLVVVVEEMEEPHPSGAPPDK